MSRLPDPPVCKFGEAIDAIRAVSGWSITEFAEYVGTTQDQISKYRQGGKPESDRLAQWSLLPKIEPHFKKLTDALAADRAEEERAALEAARISAAAAMPPSSAGLSQEVQAELAIIAGLLALHPQIARRVRVVSEALAKDARDRAAEG